jgi:RNA polymerase sigma-B factor
MLDDRAGLERAFEVLDRRERIIIYLRFFNNLAQAEIAKRMNVSQMHVSRLQQRALAKLQRYFNDA